jgi:hypothetical protein
VGLAKQMGAEMTMTDFDFKNPQPGRSPGNPLPSLEWPDKNPPPSWWGLGRNGELTKVYRDYRAYVDD